MKKILIILLTFFLSSTMIGQSVQLVPANDGEGAPIINALIQYVVADTNAQGEQLHDIYKLERGKTYFYNQGPIFKNPITLVADEPGDTDETKPPKILITTDDAGEAPYEHCITTFADLTVKNIAFSTTTIEGAYSWANIILLQADGLKIVMEGCIFELSGWGMIEAAVDNSVFYLNKCRVRNGEVFPDGDEWVPFFFEIDTGTIDTIIATNNTFFNLQGSVINIEQQNAVNYLLFDHNTIVNVVKGFSTEINAHLNSTFTNNIFYNVTVHGAMKEGFFEGGGDHVVPAILPVDTLISNEPNAPDSIAFIMAEADRKMVVKNNCYFYSQGVNDYWTELSDSIFPNVWMDERTQSMFDDDANWPNFVEENNVNIDPGFANFGGTDQMVEQLKNSRWNGSFGFWGWDPDSAMYPDIHWAFLQWPLPEDFSYSANLVSTDGFHVGSLQHYPDELASYTTPTDVEDFSSSSVPQSFALEQNYPNPFNPSTSVRFTLPETGAVTLIIYNSIGQKVKDVINNEILNAGSHFRNVDMSAQSSGIYFYVLKQKSSNQTRKMMLLK